MLPPLQQMQMQQQQMQPNPAQAQMQTLQQLGSGGNAMGYKVQKIPSVIPLNAVFENARRDFSVRAEPMATSNKYRGINGEISTEIGQGDLSLQGGYGRMFGVNKGPAEVEIGAKYTRGFAAGGFVDGTSLSERIGPDTQQQINGMMASGGLASYAKGGSVKDKLRAEFEKRGLDFEKFLNTPEGAHNAARILQGKGQNGDTILAHINPREAAMLRQMGGSGRINPETGLPSFDDYTIGGGDYGGGVYGSSGPIGGSIGGDWGNSYGGVGDYSSSYLTVPGFTPGGSYTIDVPGYTSPTTDWGSYGTSDTPAYYDPNYGQTPGGDAPYYDYGGAGTQSDYSGGGGGVPSYYDYGGAGTQSDYSGSGSAIADYNQLETNFPNDYPVWSGDTTPSNSGYFNDQQQVAAQEAAQQVAAQEAAQQAAAQEAAQQAAAEAAAAEAARVEAARVEAARIAEETTANQQTANVDSLTSGLGLSSPAAYSNLTREDVASGQTPFQAGIDASQAQTPAKAASSLADIAATLLGISPAAAATMPTDNNVGNRENTNSSALPNSKVVFGDDLANADLPANLYNFYQAGTSSTGPSGFGPNPQVGPANNFTTPYYPSATEAQGMNPMGSQGDPSKGYYSQLDATGKPVALPAGQNSLFISGQGPSGQVLDQSYMTGQPSAVQNGTPLNIEVVNARDIPNLPPMPGSSNPSASNPTVDRNYPMTPEARAVADQMQAQNNAEYEQRALDNAKGLGALADRVLGEGTTQSVLNKIAEGLQNQQNQTVADTFQLLASPQTTQNSVDLLKQNVEKNQAAIDAFTGKPSGGQTNVADNTQPELKRSTTITTIPQPNVQVAQIPTPPIAPEGLRDNSIVDRLTNSLTNKVNDILDNKTKYGINAAASLIPGVGLINGIGGLTGLYPTLGDLGQTIANGAGGYGGKGATGGLTAKDDAEIAATIGTGGVKGGGSGIVLPNVWTPAKGIAATSTGGGGGGGKIGTSGTVGTGGTVASGYPVGPLSNREFAGYADNLKRYGFGKEHQYYKYSAKGGKVSPLNAMRKA